MTTPVRIQQSIRQLETKGLTHTQIARELGVSRTTVVKYAKRDYSPVPPTGGTASRSLVAGEYARKADEWLEADRRMPRKQRHTARRVHERLVEECGFEGSYSSVPRWVKRWRQRHRGEAEGFSELEWAPGSAQVDFGQALAVVAGVERTVHFLVVSFPYSNMRYVAALPGKTAECVCHGLNKVFSHAGMVPRVLVFDNATGVGHRRADGTVTQTRLFSLFCAHYGFECFASIFLKQFLHCFSAAWAAGFQRKLHHMTAQTKTGTSPPCLYIPETQPKNKSAGCSRRRSGRKGRWRYRCPNSKIPGDWTVRECPGRRSRGGRTWTAPLSRNTPTWTT